MNEEELSEALFIAAERDFGVEIVSWQSTDGKGYFTADLKLRLPDGTRAEPDLVVLVGDELHLIEAKDSLAGALVDVDKLRLVLADLDTNELERQVSLALAEPRVVRHAFGSAVYPGRGQVEGSDVSIVPWFTVVDEVRTNGLASFLGRLSETTERDRDR